MQPELLFVKPHRVTGVAEKQTVLDQYHKRGLEFQTRMVNKQLIRKDK